MDTEKNLKIIVKINNKEEIIFKMKEQYEKPQEAVADFSNCIARINEITGNILNFKQENPYSKQKSSLFNELRDFCLGLGEDVIDKTKSSNKMICLYSHSKNSNKNIGLIWIRYPFSSGSFWVSLRKPGRKGGYGEVDPDKKLKYSGWGGYVEYPVRNKSDLEYLKKIVTYAYRYY